MPKPVSEEEVSSQLLLHTFQLKYLISVTANSLSEICRLSTNADFKNKVSALLKVGSSPNRLLNHDVQVPIKDVENEISNILSTIWVHHTSDIKALQAKRRKIVTNFGAAEFDSLFEDTE
ncbi:hypothetical protein TSMEX_010458 [Taenia solium]|eukprot:TsM_001001900 transcript=TsM_001001900 gene=TsM_001001900